MRAERRGLVGRVCHRGPGPDPFELPSPDGGLIRMVVNLFGDGWEDEEAFQECCIARLQALRTFDPAKGAWSTWLHFYCRNRLKSVRTLAERRAESDAKKGRRTPTIADDFDFDHFADPRPPDHTKCPPRVYAALASLRPRLREVIERRFYGGETLAAIAADMGVTHEGVRQLQIKAIGQLRERLGIIPPTDDDDDDDTGDDPHCP